MAQFTTKSFAKIRGPDHGRLTNSETLSVHFERGIEVVAQRSGFVGRRERLVAQARAVSTAGHEHRELAQGHDVVALLSIGLRGAIGTARAHDARIEFSKSNYD